MGRLGHYFYVNRSDLEKLNGLSNIDWLRSNSEWKGRGVDEKGRIINNDDAIIKLCNLIKIKLGISLSKEEESKENEIKG